MHKKDIQSIFPLTDSQETMLVHHLQAGAADRGRIQMQVHLSGKVDVDILRETWEYLIRVFPVLRTSIHWHNLKQPANVVCHHASCSLLVQDLTEFDEEQADRETQAFIREDNAAELDLTTAPAFRLNLLQLPGNKSLLVWTCHHILLDGWSSMLVLQELVRAYRVLFNNGNLDTLEQASFKEFADWLAARPLTRAKRFWNSQFRDLEEMPVLSRLSTASGLAPTSRPKFLKESFKIQGAENGELEHLARDCRVSPFTILLGVWAIVLSELLDSSVVVAGISVSGRNGRIPGEESMAGMLANTIPMVIRINEDLSLRGFFQSVGKLVHAYQEFDYCSARQIYDWTGQPARRPLFDSLFVFANQPFENPDGEGDLDFRISKISGAFTSTTPVNLSIWKWDSLMADILIDQGIVNPSVVGIIKSRVEELFPELGNLLSRSVSEIRRPAQLLVDAEEAGAQPGFDILAGGCPANTLEKQIHKAWKAVFDLADIGAEVDFFELGGNSLLATLLITRLNDSLDTPATIETLFEAPTIREMAELLGHNQLTDEKESLVVPIRDVHEGDKLPLVLVHGMGGSTYQYQILAKYMEEDQPLLAIRSPRDGFTDLETMIETYVDKLLERFPDGNFILGGYCFGAGIAFEMMQLMRKRGLENKPLLAIDFMFINLVRYRPKYLLKLIREESPARFYGRLRGRWMNIWQRMKRIVATPEKGIGPRIEDIMNVSALEQEDYDRIDNYYFLLKDHRPKPYDGDLALILSKSDYSRLDQYCGWDRLVKGHITVDMVQASHTRLMKEPDIKEVASTIETILRRINDSELD